MTLVELMVGMAIGLLTVLAVMQVLSVAEGMRRNTTSGANAQINGALAMDALLTDIRQAGYGLADNPTAMGCLVKRPAGNDLSLVPVMIVDGANGDPDQLLIFSSGKQGASVPVLVAGDHPQAGTSFAVQSSVSVDVNDLMVAVPSTWDNVATYCSLFAVTATGLATVDHVAGAHFPAGGYKGIASKTVNSYLLNFGTAPRYRSYAITSDAGNSDRTLQVRDFSAATATALTAATDAYPEIVNLQALYGKDTNNDGVVDTYDATAPATAAGWQQVLAIRVALVARSNQFERDEVTDSEPEWNLGSVATVTGSANCVSVNGSKCLTLKISDLADWKHYRYKVFNTVIPLRNVLWNS